MPPPSLAREFFDRIVTAAEPVTAIRGLINPDPALTTAESDWLDFKTEDPDPKQRDKKIKETWSPALSGFANNQGGVLIWGIDARKTKIGGVEIDVACGEKPMTDPLAVRSRLVELQRGATDPPLGNVEIKAYELPGNPGKGFIVCFVPEGPFKPYRAEQAGQQWYIRAGDNFVVMSRGILQAMFYPRMKAFFRATATLSWSRVEPSFTGTKKVAPFACTVELVNDGAATAKNTIATVRQDVQCSLTPLQFSSDWVSYSREEGREFAASGPLHPGRTTRLFTAKWQMEAVPSEKPTGSRMVPYGPPPSFELTLFCDNQEPQTFRLGFDMQEVIDFGQCVREVMPVA